MKTCWFVDFAVPGDHKIILKDKYLDLARELKKELWNMKIIINQIVICALDTVIKGLVQELDE